jgi:hypothetical protein
MIRRIGSALLASVSVVCSAEEQPSLPDEFAVTDSIVMTDEDEFYVSPAIEYFHLPDQKRFSIATEVAYGFTDRFQLRVDVPYESVNPDDGHSANGIGDVEVAARYAVLDHRTRPFALDVGLSLLAPTGDRRRDLGDGRLAVEPFFTASQWLGPVNLELNFAWLRAVSSAGDDPKNEYDYNVALAYPVHDWFLVLEGNGETNSRHTMYYITPEVVWEATEHFQFHFAVPIGVTRAAGDYGVVAGFTVEFEHLLHRKPEKD